MSNPSLVLGIETSCDETAAAVLESNSAGCRILSSVVSSQASTHAATGGVVPEVASRAHLENLLPVVDSALQTAEVKPADVSVVAATTGPGLVGALLVGASAAKALSMSWDVPFVGVNHLHGHIYAAFLEEESVMMPLVALLVSGGHTMLVEMTDHQRFRLLGQTRDDAAGEAFDKVARLLGLGYPGGPEIDRLAAVGNPEAVDFPRPMLNDGLDFSFSGLKTAVANYLRKHGGETGVVANSVAKADAGDVATDVAADVATNFTADVAASFQRAVVDVLIAKTEKAVSDTTKSVCLAGGVAANSELRERFAQADTGVPNFLPSRAMCTDNATMIAAAAWHQLTQDGPSPLTTLVNPSWSFQ